MKFTMLCLLLIISWCSFAQNKDTIYIKFNASYEEMIKQKYKFSEDSGISYGYFIRQMEKDTFGDIFFIFSHPQRDEKHNRYFGKKNATILEKPKSFLNNKEVLDIEFFRTTPYIEVAKTFEEEDSWEQDVVIFMMDVDEIKNDSFVLREVTFTRPVKQ